MEFRKYSYDVSAQVTFTGRELWLMQECCSTHGDGKTQAIFQSTYPGQGELRGFGFGWCNRFSWAVEPTRELEDDDDVRGVGKRHPEANTEVTVSTDQLDALMKGLEAGHYLRGDDGADAMSLTIRLRGLFFRLQDEWKRLNYTPYKIDVLEERKTASGKMFVVARGVARVDHKVIHNDVCYLVVAFDILNDEQTGLFVKPLEEAS